MKLRQYEQGKRFCDGVVERAGIAGLNRVWEAPDRLPTLAELDDPAAGWRAPSPPRPDRSTGGRRVPPAGRWRPAARSVSAVAFRIVTSRHRFSRFRVV